MQELKVIGLEGRFLVVTNESGERFAIANDAVLHDVLRPASSKRASDVKVSPREIQGMIRSGMPATEVARQTGADEEYVARFEGPVLAERRFMVESALRVPVRTAADIDPLTPGSTFGAEIDERLETLRAADVSWDSWKDVEQGWLISLVFTIDGVEHDARWTFEPKKSALSPSNSEAMTLSQQGAGPERMMPRLRAVDSPNESNSADRAHSDAPIDRPAALPAQRKTAPTTNPKNRDFGDTSDLLEALRRKRGEREAAPQIDEADEQPDAASRSARVSDFTRSGIRRKAESPEPKREDGEADEKPAKTDPNSTAPQGKRGSRATMPSWDEIVFGSKNRDED